VRGFVRENVRPSRAPRASLSMISWVCIGCPFVLVDKKSSSLRGDFDVTITR
jgi:hypothetical protein